MVNGLSSHRHLDDILDVADVDAVTSGFLAVDLYFHISFANELIGEHVRRSADGAQDRGDFLANALNVVELGAENLDGNRQSHASRKHLDPGGDRLGKAVAPARHLQGRVHLFDDVVFRLAPEQQPVGERFVQRGAERRQLTVGEFSLIPSRALDSSACREPPS